MKDTIKLISVMLVSIFLCGCTDLIAAKKLYKTADEMFRDGDFEGAISRLESSLELVPEQYDARYMLMQSYLATNKCDKALEEILILQDSEKKEPAVYEYSAEIYTCIANNISKKELKSTDNIYLAMSKNPNAAKRYIHNLEKTNESYNKYLDLIPNIENKDDIMFAIKTNKEKIERIKSVI